MKLVITICLFILAANAAAADSLYLFVWAGDADKQQSDFLAVLDADPASVTYGNVLSTVTVGLPTGAHHSEHRMPAGNRLFVNGFSTGHSFVIDLVDPSRPTVAAHFTDVGTYSYPHSFERLPNGNVLATFQNTNGKTNTVGGLVELDSAGQMVRASSARTAGFPEVRPYSLTILPGMDRVVSTTTDMRLEAKHADSIQLWRLSDLALLHTLRLPPGPRGDENRWPAEPRLLDDGRSLMVNTFACGLYRVHDVDSDQPRVEHVYSFEMKNDTQMCALPVSVGPFWVQTVPARNGLVTLDMSEPDHPREVGYVFLGDGAKPHWISLSPDGTRIVVTGFDAILNSVIIVNLDLETGALEVDRDFGIDGTVTFGRTNWPHGASGAAIPHGSVFSLPQSEAANLAGRKRT